MGSPKKRSPKKPRPALTLEVRDDRVAVLTFDTPDLPVNTFRQSNIAGLASRIDELEQSTEVRGLIFRSGKAGNFIAGADLNELLAADEDRCAVRALIERGHELFTRISRLPFPTVAAVDGICVGGGLECVLAFDYRLLSDNPRTELGAPEVKIGIIPGWGGTQRLPRIVGIDKAIELICGGNSISPAEAVDIGLAWAVVPADQLIDEATRLIGLARELGDWQPDRQRREQPMGLSPDNMVFNFAVARGFVLGQTKGHYPAPIVALEAIEQGCNVPLRQGLKHEIEKVLPLVGSSISRNLIALFFMDQRVRKDSGVADGSVKPRPVRRAGVLGAGQMGAGIAFAHARRRLYVTMSDVDDDLIDAGLKRVRKPMEGRIKIGRMTIDEAIDALAKIRTTSDKTTMGDCDLIIEAIVENKDVKVPVLKEMESVVTPETIIASNTSTISISSMADQLSRPEQFIGMHFFYPVDRMQLVEVIRGRQTSEQAVATVVAHAKSLGKKPIVVNDCPGFVVNRCLLPYMNEAFLMVEEGLGMQEIDKAITRFGLPMGPIALTDLVGLDVSLFAGGVLAEAYADRAVPCRILPKLVKQGRLGQKSGAGFYAYDPKKKAGAPDGVVDQLVKQLGRTAAPPERQTVQDRLLLAMLTEAVRLLEENIARTPEDVDFGLTYGIGFPPFRGGLLRWCDSLGAATVVDRLAEYESLGKRFECPKMLADMAKSGKRFFPS